VLVIDARNEKAAAWYASYGAMPLLDASLSLPLPLATTKAALKSLLKNASGQPPQPQRPSLSR
jgi:hypothetical protein